MLTAPYPALSRRVGAVACAGGLCTVVVWGALYASALAPRASATSVGTVGVLLAGWVAAGAVAAVVAGPSRGGATLSALSAGAHVLSAEVVLGLPASVVVGRPWLMAAVCAAIGHVLVSPTEAVRVHARVVAFAGFTALMATTAAPAGAWISGARLRVPTAAQAASGGVDLTVDTHQWFAAQGTRILAGDGHADLEAFFDELDPTAPGTITDAAPGAGPFTYRWRLLRGARDADGRLYPEIRDHFHNLWTHRGRQWTIGASAASNAEAAFGRAVARWQSGQRGEAMYWLGAAVHLLDDACVPQHQFFAVNPYHHQYELWVSRQQARLAVDTGGIYQTDFRARSGHGGNAWSSAHPRGWVDECAHRAARNLQAASHPNSPSDSALNDPRWRTAPHIADTQRLTAGFIRMFFERVGGP